MKMWILLSAAIFALTPFVYAKSAAATQHTNASQTPAVREAWPPETISGTISTVDTQQNLVILRDSSGTPFDFVMTPSTRIESGNHRVVRSALSSDTNKTASVRFIPQRRGDVAQLIQVQ
jgi:hypothetical protein